MKHTKLSRNQIGEYLARDFYGEEEWKRMKQDLDNLLSYRKSIKGKPNPEQLFVLELNKPWIDMYKRLLFSQSLMDSGKIRSEFKQA